LGGAIVLALPLKPLFAMAAALPKEISMTRTTILRIFSSALSCLAALAGCRGKGEDAPMSIVVIDTSTVPTYDAIAQAAAAEHGAPGENEQFQYVLVGENAPDGLVAALHEHGFANVSVGGR
jgi:hypothetical protein